MKNLVENDQWESNDFFVSYGNLHESEGGNEDYGKEGRMNL